MALKIIGKIIGIFAWIFIGILALSLLLCVVVYIPAVQRFAVEKASAIVAEKTGYRLSVDELRVRFPLGVSARGARFVMPAGDTVVDARVLKVRLALVPLLSGRVSATDISVENGGTSYLDTVSAFRVSVRFDALSADRLSLDPNGYSIKIFRARLSGADVKLRQEGDPSRKPVADTIPFPGQPWRVDVDHFELSGSRFAMDLPSGAADNAPAGHPATDSRPSAAHPPAAFDPYHIDASELRALVHNFSYGGSDISAHFEGLDFLERSGLRVENSAGDFSMTADNISMTDFTISTPASQLKIDAVAGYGIVNGDNSAPVSLNVSGAIAANEMLLFIPPVPEVEHILRGRNLTVDASAGGTLADLSIENLTADMQGSASLRAHGRIRSLTAAENISGDVVFDGELEDTNLVKDLITDTALYRRIAIPRPIRFGGEGSFSPDAWNVSRFTLTAAGGRLDARGRFAMKEKAYDADVRVARFPIGDFLPGDSLGVATLSVAVHGCGFDPAGEMTGEAGISVDRFDYGSVDLGKITADLSIRGGRIKGAVKSRSEVLFSDVTLDAVIERDTLPVAGRSVPRGISGAPAGPSTPAAGKMRYTLVATIDSTAIRLGDGTRRIAAVTVRASASAAGSSAAVRSGDLSVDLTSPLPLDSLVAGARAVVGEVSRQLAARHFSADSLQSAFPGVTLTARAGRGNFLRDMARLQGFDFRTIAADISTVAGQPFSIDGTVTGLGTGKFTLDTIVVSAHRNGSNLDYSLRMANRPGGNDNLGLISVSGSAGGNRLTVDVLQRNMSDSTGFRFGVNASLVGKTLRAEMTPADPILGYERWRVSGGGDWVEYDTDGKFRADLHLSSSAAPRQIDITSASLPDILNGALRLRTTGIGIAPMLSLMLTAPPVDGTLSSDLTLGLIDGADKKIIAANGTLEVADLLYNGRRVADVAADVDFRSDTAGRMALDASVMLEHSTALTATGTYTAEQVDLSVAIPAVPLSAGEAFLPAEAAAKLSGNLDGRLRITGVPTAPVVSGDLGVTGGRANVEMIGTALGISEGRITIADNRISFNDFGITSPNGKELTLGGSVNISDLANPIADLHLSASDFQIVNSRYTGGSQIYGTAAFDADITARGALSAVTVRGNVDVSQNTDIVYTLRSQSRVQDEKQHIVEFTVFADSLFTDGGDTLPRLRRPGVDMLVGITIGEGARATLSLDELNENRVELIGGGALSFSMNTQGDARLSGRYTLSGGTVYYRPPVIAQKVFDVTDGSYVEWTGETTAPQFHVTATQTSDILLDYDDGMSEDVAFDISVDISGSPAAMDMRFDVAAPGNIAIQNQLLSMSDEQRMQQALTLLIYEQYTGPGVSSKGASFDARRQLNSFITKEVNQWARNNLKGIDLSMGIDTRNDPTGNTHTDYSYSISKSIFSDRVKVSIGGSVADNATSQNFANNLIDDVSLLYRIDRRDNMFLKLYRYNTRASILEGEVTETGGGFMMRKKINKLGDLFRRTNRTDKKNDK